jgi:hypothetical protein
LLDWFDGEVDPDEGDVFLSNPAVKHYWINRQLFALDGGKVLWKLREGENGAQTRLLVIPAGLRTEVMRLCHDIPASGHQGIDRTKSRLRDRFLWYGMKEAEQYVSSCEPCSRNKRPQRHARAEMLKYHAGSPIESVHLDFLGPLPETPKENVYVLVMVDQFTKWVECVCAPPIPDGRGHSFGSCE